MRWWWIAAVVALSTSCRGQRCNDPLGLSDPNIYASCSGNPAGTRQRLSIGTLDGLIAPASIPATYSSGIELRTVFVQPQED